MGASRFCTFAVGKTLQEAFEEAAALARHEHGHGGYSGTIAEKHACHIISPAPTPEIVAKNLRHAADMLRRGEPCGAFNRDDIARMRESGETDSAIARLERMALDVESLTEKPIVVAEYGRALAFGMMEADHTYADKWGPAHGFEFGRSWCIFGMAPE